MPELVEKIQEDKKRVAKLEAAAQPLIPKKNAKDGFVKLVFRNGHVYEGQVGAMCVVSCHMPRGLLHAPQVEGGLKHGLGSLVEGAVSYKGSFKVQASLTLQQCNVHPSHSISATG